MSAPVQRKMSKHELEMQLPPGKTCADCFYLKRCLGLGCTKPENTNCDFWPNRFVEKGVTPGIPWSESLKMMRESLSGRPCPYCRRSGVYSPLVYDRQRRVNERPTCKETLVGE